MHYFLSEKGNISPYSSKDLSTTLPLELIISKDVCLLAFIYLENHLFNPSIPNLDLEISFYLTSVILSSPLQEWGQQITPASELSKTWYLPALQAPHIPSGVFV